MAESVMLLRLLMTERHWQSHARFCREYDRAARSVDPSLEGTAPGRAQLHRWLSGRLKGLPYPSHCLVLEAMFPGWTVQQLFSAVQSDDPAVARAIRTTERGHRATEPFGESSEFRRFVGREIAEDGVTLVYPTFALAPAAEEALTEAGLPRQHFYAKKQSKFAVDHRIDVPVAVAENDVRALVYVSSMLERNTSVAVDILCDSEVVERCDRPFISFGLSSNDCTHMYLSLFEDPLFMIEDSEDSSRYLEHIVLPDGRSYRSTDDTNVGIIARQRPSPLHNPDRNWFYCAGLGTRGTTGASWFLANHWRDLHEQVGSDDFIAVVEVQSFSDQTARLEDIHVPARRDVQG